MRVIICTETEAWPGIVAALAQAQPGDIVRLQPGRYAGRDTLAIPSGVSLTGEFGVVLVFEADGPAVRFQDGAESSLAGVKIVAAPSGIAPAAAATDDPVPGGPGLICIERSRGIRVAGMEILAPDGAKDHRHAITLLASEDCAISGCTIASAGQTGILLVSSQARIQGNEIHGMTHGIALGRSALTAGQPSKARIEDNRCHDNTGSGIVLFSSEAETIAQNRCWTNGSCGIALGRDPNSRDKPSKARIEHNCCHNNNRAGIFLASSEAETIAQNECWGNENNGILLQCDEESDAEAARPRIEHNRSHHNIGSGIVLFSSEAETIWQNECWGNQKSGIAVECLPDGRGKPSRVRIEHNRCHNNDESGIVLFSSEADAIAQNECWNNQGDGIALERHPNSRGQPSRAPLIDNFCDHNGRGFALSGAIITALERNRIWDNRSPSLIPQLNSTDPAPCTPPESAVATAPDPGAAERRRRLARGGTLEALLLDNGFAAPGPLARFASGLGCSKCLAAAWPHGPGHPPPRRLPSQNGQPQPVRPYDPIPGVPVPKAIGSRVHHADTPGHTPPQTGRLYRLTQDAELNPAVFTPSGKAHLTGWVWQFARQVALGKANPVKIIGVLGGNRRGVLQALAHDARLLREAEHGHEDRLLAESPSCHAAFAAFDGQGRRIGALLDIDCAARAALEMAGAIPAASLFQRETLGFKGETPARAELWRARSSLLLRPLPLLTLAALIGALLIVLAAFGHFRDYPGGLSDVRGAAWHYLWTVITGSQLWDWKSLLAIICIGPASAAYMANRFLPSILRLKLHPSIYDLARRSLGLDKWFKDPDDNNVALRWVARRLFGKNSSQGFALLALRNPDLWTEADLDRLQKLVKKRPDGQGLAIIVPISSPAQILSGLLRPWVDPDTRRLRQDLNADVELLVLPEPASQAETLPIKDPLDLLGIKKREDDPRQHIYDALRDDRLTINDIVPLLVFGSTPETPFVIAYDGQNAAPSLDEVMAPYIQFVSDNPGETPMSFQPAEAEGRVLRSPCTLLHADRAAKRTHRNLIGRGTYRAELTATLRPVFETMGADFTAYTSVLAGCGQLYNLRKAARELDSEPLSSAQLAKIALHLRAAAALAQEASPLPGQPHRAEMILAAWTDLAARLPLSQADTTTPTLAVEVIGLAFGAAAPSDAAQDRLLAVIAPPTPAGAQTPPTLQAICAGEIERVLSALAELDPVYAGRVLERLFAGAWRPLAAAHPSLSARLAALRAAIPPLSERLAAAPSYEAFAALLQAHRGDLPRFMALCDCIAARGADTLAAQQRLVGTIVKHTAAGLQIDPDITVGAPKQAGMIIDHLDDPRTTAIIQAAVKTAEAEEDPGDAIYLDSFDRASAEIRNLVTVVLRSRAANPPAQVRIAPIRADAL